jgi:transposase
MRTATAIKLTPEVREQLLRYARGRSVPKRLVERAGIVLRAADGQQSQLIAAGMGLSRPTVQLWRDRFARQGVAGIEKDAPRPGRKPKLATATVRRVIQATLETTPPQATHWSVRTMAKTQGISRMAVQRIWAAHNLKPHLVETFKLSNDPRFVEKLVDVVGLYLDPPDRALVLCVDEKSQIQALDRTRPLLPLRPGIPARQTHDYERHGTTTLFAALNMLDGSVIGACMPRHRHGEFLKFLMKLEHETDSALALHLIVDNYCTHKHPRVTRWLNRHRRFHLHFIPTSSSWLNLIERWFREITDKRIRRGTFRNVRALIAAITQYLENHNQNPHVFVWSAPVERILAKIAKCKEALDAPHWCAVPEIHCITDFSVVSWALSLWKEERL